MIYEIYINNQQFTCLYESIDNEKNIPNIIGFPGLIFINKETYADSSKIYYKLNDLIEVKINLNNKIIFEKLFPLSISLKRLRDLLKQNINSNFKFTYNNNIIQIQEEYSFCLKNIIKNNIIYLYDNEFTFFDEKQINENKNNIFDSEVEKDKMNNFGNLQIFDNKEQEQEEKEPKQIKPEDGKKEKQQKNNINENSERDQQIPEKSIDIEYELHNRNNNFGKIKINPEVSLNVLREKIINLIPRRTVFLMNNTKLDPSKEEKIYVKDIAKQNIIEFEFPVEDKNETMEIEIFLNGKPYIKKEYYLHIKLKFLRINLKLDKLHRFLFKGKILSTDQENQITLDELCYKEPKCLLIKVEENKSDNNELSIKNINLNNNFNLEKKVIKNTFRANEDYDVWIILGKEKSGKTTFIDCLFNYLSDVKIENKYRYSIESIKKPFYEIYDIQGIITSQKIRIFEFAGFSGELNEDKQINENIKKVIKTLKEVKLICFIISGNETRLTDDLKNIFSNIWNIFAVDIKSNFIFIITNCDAKQPPVIDCIKESNFSKFLPKPIENIIFKFNNSYLYEINQKDFWNIGVSNYVRFIDTVNTKENISMNLTKYLISFDFKKNSKIFLESIYKSINYNYFFSILKNINSNEQINIDIPFDFIDTEKICAGCKKKFTNNFCYCGSTRYREQQIQKNKISLKNLKKNNKLFVECFNRYKYNLKDQIIYSAGLYKDLKNYYNSKLYKNNTLENELGEMIDKNDSNKNFLIKEILRQESLYKEYLNGKYQNQIDYKNYLNNILNIQ